MLFKRQFLDKYASSSPEPIWCLNFVRLNLHDICFLKTDTRLRNPDKLLTNLQYNDVVTEVEAAGYEFPPDTTEMLQQALIAFSRLENHDDELIEQGDEEEEEEEDDEGDDNLDIDGARLSYSV